MSIYVEDLREFIIRPTLTSLGDWSLANENLLLGTAAQESQLGFRIGSNCNSYQLGIYCISPWTHIEVWDKYLITDPELASRLRGLASQQQFLKSPHAELITNLGYATGVAWMIYRRNNLVLSDNMQPRELAHYWLDYYNTRDIIQAARPKELELDRFEKNFKKLVLCNNNNLAA